MLKFLREQWYMLSKTPGMPESRRQHLMDEANRLNQLNHDLGNLIISIENCDLKITAAQLQRESLRKWHKTCMALDLDYNVSDMSEGINE